MLFQILYRSNYSKYQSMRGRTLFTQKPKKSQWARKSCSKVHPSISSFPTYDMGEAEFNFEYSQFTKDDPIAHQVKQNLKYLYELFTSVCSKGGIVNVCSNDLFSIIKKQMSIKYSLVLQISNQQMFQHYLNYELFNFQIVIKSGKRIEKQKLSCLKYPIFIQTEDIKKYLNDLSLGLDIYKRDIVVFKQIISLLGFNEHLFSIEKLSQKYSEQNVKVIIHQTDETQIFKHKTQERYRSQNCKQTCENNACPSYFNLHDLQNTIARGKNFQKHKNNVVQSISFKEYYSYYQSFPLETLEERQQSLKDKTRLHLPQSDQQKIMYAIQFDPKDDFYLNQFIKRLDGTFLCFKQKFDLLSYLDQDCPSITLPKFSFQLESNWMGGQQQMFGMAKVDFNFGPGKTEWYCLPSQSISKFIETIQKDHQQCVWKFEGEWFENIDWFIQKQIQITKTIQNKGDAVVIGNGSLYWCRSYGKSTHVSWNIMPKSQNQIKSIVLKTKNQKSFYRQKSILSDICIPIKTIFLRALNHQQYINEKSREVLSPNCLVIIRQWLKKWYGEEEKILSHLTIKQNIIQCKFRLYYLFDIESYCIHCKKQVINYFINNNGLSCLDCLIKVYNTNKKFILKDRTIYFKYEPFWLYQLLYYGRNRAINSDETGGYQQFQELCNGEFIRRNDKCKKSQHKNQIETKDYLDIVENQQEWQITLSNFINQKKLNGKQNPMQYLIEGKIEGRSKKCIQNMNQSYFQQKKLSLQYDDNNIQTDLSLLCEITDENIFDFIKQKVNNRYSSQNSYNGTLDLMGKQNQFISKESLMRKQRRNNLRYGNEQKSESQYSEELMTKATCQSSSLHWKKKSERDKEKQFERERERERQRQRERQKQRRQKKERYRQKERQKERQKQRQRQWQRQRQRQRGRQRQKESRKSGIKSHITFEKGQRYYKNEEIIREKRKIRKQYRNSQQISECSDEDERTKDYYKGDARENDEIRGYRNRQKQKYRNRDFY